jgi:hypothetical protein
LLDPKLAKCLSDDLPNPDPRRAEQLAKDKKKIDKLRRRLCSVSWFVGILSLGLIPISLDDYIKLARWTVQAWRSGEPKTIPADLEAVLEGLDIRADAWQQSLEDYEQEFGHAVGPPSALAEVAARMEGHHIKGIAASRRLFRESSAKRAAG